MIKINLLPVPIRRRIEFLVIQLVVGVAAILATLMFCVYYGGQYDRQLTQLTSETQRLQRDIETEKRKVGNLNRLQQQQSELRSQINVIQSLEKSRSGPVRLLDELAQIMPEKVWITSFSEKGGKVTMNCQAVSKAAIAEFVESLQKSKLFSGVEMGRITTTYSGDKETSTFEIRSNIKYGV